LPSRATPYLAPAADTNITATPVARARVGREDGQRPQKDLLGTAKPGERLQARSGRGMEIIPYQNFFHRRILTSRAAIGRVITASCASLRTAAACRHNSDRGTQGRD
jgi:hypothetical protein